MKIVLKIIRRYLPAAKKQFAAVIFWVLIITALEAFLSVLMSGIVTEAQVQQTVSFLIAALFCYFVLLIVDAVLSVLKFRAQDRLGGVFLEELRTSLYHAVEQADYEELLSIGKDRLKHIFYSDVLDAFRVIGNYIGYMLLNVVLLISFLVVAAFLNVMLAVFLFVAAVTGFVISWISRKYIVKLSSCVNQKMKADNAELNQFIDSLELVKTHSLTAYFIGKQKRSLWDFIHTSMRTDSAVTGIHALGTNYYQFVYLAVAAVLSMVLTGNDAGSLAFFLFATQKVISFSDNLETGIWQMMRMAPSFGNVDQILSLGQREAADSCSKAKTPEADIREIHEIEFRDVSFSYRSGKRETECEEERNKEDSGEEKQDGQKNSKRVDCNSAPLLSHINQVFYQGDVIQITGANGSGKSTWMKLLTGLLKPAEGEILMNGIPMFRISRDSRKRCIVYISQDEILLNDSPKQYLEQISGQKLSEKRYHDLLAEVGLDPDLPDIEAGGMNLSGGQRKKLMLLKLKLRWNEASVILLDEIENALDQETREYAAALLKEIYEDRENHIIFRISHMEEPDEYVNKRIVL